MLLRKPVVLPALEVVCMLAFVYVWWGGGRPLCWGGDLTPVHHLPRPLCTSAWLAGGFGQGRFGHHQTH